MSDLVSQDGKLVVDAVSYSITVNNLFELVRFVEVRHFATAQDVVDVLDERLLDDLRVHEQEHRRSVLHSGHEVQTLQICRITH